VNIAFDGVAHSANDCDVTASSTPDWQARSVASLLDDAMASGATQ